MNEVRRFQRSVQKSRMDPHKSRTVLYSPLIGLCTTSGRRLKALLSSRLSTVLNSESTNFETVSQMPPPIFITPFTTVLTACHAAFAPVVSARHAEERIPASIKLIAFVIRLIGLVIMPKMPRTAPLISAKDDTANSLTSLNFSVSHSIPELITLLSFSTIHSAAATT